MLAIHRAAKVIGISIFILISALACGKGDKGDVGPAGPPGESGGVGPAGTPGGSATALGTVTGTVSDYHNNKVAGARISAPIGKDTASTVSDAAGVYSLQIPPGARVVTIAADGYTSYKETVEAGPGKVVTLNGKLNPTGPAAVTAIRTDTTTPVLPGTQITAQAKALIFAPALQGKAVTYKWSVASGPAVTFDDDTSATPKITLGSAAAFKKYMIESFATPLYKVNPDEPAVNIDRVQVVPISYEAALAKGNTTVLRVTVTVGSQIFKKTLPVAATIPAVPSSGLVNVPVGQPVVLQGQFPFKKADGSYVFAQRTDWNWSIAGPSGVAVTLNDATSAYPDFTPPVAGTYVISEGGKEKLQVFAGTYKGAMAAAGAADSVCVLCHGTASNLAFDAFTPWLKTGHRDVMYAGIREALPDGHYTASCTPCHTVGQGAVGSGGFADKAAAEHVDFGMLQGDTNAEADYWSLYPNSAKLAGVQCETCHGPQDGHVARVPPGPQALTKRMSFSSNVCATCHARAPRHGRFSQWILSGHSNFSTFTFNAREDGTLANTCACCHSAQGFKAYRAILPTANGDRSKTVLPADLRVTNAEPITCVACHDMHSEGEAGKVDWSNLSAVGPSEGNTYMLPSGFAAVGVGKGALCISCHNSRQGISGGKPYLHEDGDSKFGAPVSYGAPHEAAQGDVLLGRNGYWLGAETYGSPQTRSKHSHITDTCVTCHMQLTTLDPALSMDGQTRHDFKATPDVCNKCHTAYSTESVQAAFDPQLLKVKQAIGNAILRLKYNDAIPAGTSAALVANRSAMVDVTTTEGTTTTTRRWFIGDKTGQDAYLADPNNGGALVQGCTMKDAISADCAGFLRAAPGVAAIGSTATLDGTVTATGFNPVIAKALWNTVLVQDDASRGVHNPSFTWKVIDATLTHVASFTK